MQANVEGARGQCSLSLVTLALVYIRLKQEKETLEERKKETNEETNKETKKLGESSTGLISSDLMSLIIKVFEMRKCISVQSATELFQSD